MSKPIGVAFPWTERDRAALRAVTEGRLPIPIVKPGSQLWRCPRCSVQIAVGPLLAASGLDVICAGCAHELGMEGYC